MGQSFVDGLSQHIAKLLRNFRAQVGSGRTPGLYASKTHKIGRSKNAKKVNTKERKRKKEKRRKRKLRLAKKRLKKELKEMRMKMTKKTDPNNS